MMPGICIYVVINDARCLQISGTKDEMDQSAFYACICRYAKLVLLDITIFANQIVH